MDRTIVSTDLFQHRAVKSHFINPCCFGEDFAAWLKGELARFPEPGLVLADPIQEDYGWGFFAIHGTDRFWIAISYVGDGPQEGPVQWVISVSIDPGLNMIKRFLHQPPTLMLEEIRSRVHGALESNPAIHIIGVDP